MDYLTTQYDYSESSICRIISTIEQILINCKELTVKGKNKLKKLRNTKLVINCNLKCSTIVISNVPLFIIY